jgi:methylmalonyl-CoA mutase
MANLLSEFPPVSTAAWEHAIADDLKGVGEAEKLVWRSPEGIEVKPFYRAADLAGLDFLAAAPEDFPFPRGTRAMGGWRIREVIDAVDPEEANSAARCAVAAGVEEIAFSRAAATNASDLGILLANLGEIPVHFEHATPAAIRRLLDRMVRRQSGTLRSADLDWSDDPDFSADLIARAPAYLVPFTIRADAYGESGATAIEEAGFALASGVDFIAAMQERGVAADRAADAVAFSFAMGPEYFMQIAKLRAFRMAWAQAMESFGGAREHARARIDAHSSRWNRTVYDPHVNMLRATTEAMSAVLGGADSIDVAPFDECYCAADEASRRLARNTQIILKQEAHLARVADAAGGSYYIENLTGAIARGAWKQLQQIEAGGGFRKATNLVAETLAARKAARDEAVATRRRVLTGTNRFAHPVERALDRIEASPADHAPRAAQPFESLRLRTELHAAETGSRPRILLAEIGDPKMRSARSNFVSEFFACAGLATDIRQFETPQQIAAADADLIVLCSSDPEYLAVATQLLAAMQARGKNTPALVAGCPASTEQLCASGITDFIHLRTNPIKLLTKLQRILGISE